MAPWTSCRISVSGHQDVVGKLEPHSLGHGILLLIGAEMSERRKYFSELTETGLCGTLDQLQDISVWTSRRGGHTGTTFFGPQNTAADRGRDY